MSTFRADVRTAAVALLKDFADDMSYPLANALTVYRGRPASIHPPQAFVDTIRERLSDVGHLQQRLVEADLLVLFGRYDSGEAVDQADQFVDGFRDWVAANFHEAGAATLVSVREVEDVPAYVNDWMAPELQKTWFATRITLEGYAEG